ncbi:MAG TPA: class I SAM-dependent methyltransferase, partial [Thermoanaerobaculia bacterium]|nr:class I SAM-dependent methyltransferase [Thermoanaerobaculia bacterium]
MASEAAFDPCASADVADCLGDLIALGIDTRLHPSDEMYRFELAQPRRSPETAAVFYFSTGRSIWRTVSRLVSWRFGGFANVRSALDFASGYGRTTRFLARALDARAVTAAEIDAGAVRFQEETFGVRGCVSGPDPARLTLPESFDLVLAVSFFSHLPAGRFERWLGRLYGRVAPGGLLLFSTHGAELYRGEDPIPPSGLLFRPESETTRLEASEYGTSWVTEAFVRRAATEVAGAAPLWAFPYGLCGFQDLYALAKGPAAGEGPRLARDPWGTLEFGSVEGGVVQARGWASGDRGE